MQMPRPLTGKGADESVANLNRDTANAHTAAAKQDVAAMETEAELERGFKNQVFREATKYSDESYRTMFVEKAPMAVVERNLDGSLKYDEKGNPVMRILSTEEKANLQAGPDGKIHVANNGIFNDLEGAAKYAAQHSTSGDGPQYFIYFPQADNIVSELMIAGYMKFLENSTTGLSNATRQNVDLLNKYGDSGLHLDGHSRGSMTVGNALEAVRDQSNSNGAFNGTTVHFFGPAYNAQKADQILSGLQGRDNLPGHDQQASMMLQFQNHTADPVGMLNGQNPGTGGTIPNGSSSLWEAFRAATGQPTTVHNCYGAANSDACGKFWEDSGNRPRFVPARPIFQ